MRLAGRIEPGSGSGALTGHLGGSATFGLGVAAGVFTGPFGEGGALLAAGRARVREESTAGRWAEADEAERSQASDAKTILAAGGGQARRAIRPGFIYTR